MNFKELRKSKNFTQKEMAKILGVDQKTYSNYENNKTEPTLSAIIKLVDYFQISLDSFINNKIDFLKLENLSLLEIDVIKAFLSLNTTEQNQVFGFIKALKKDKN